MSDLFQTHFPIGADTICSDLYVDDLLTGADNMEELEIKKTQIIALLAMAGLKMTKFKSNFLKLVDELETEIPMHFDEQGKTKTLDLAWKPKPDKFIFRFEFLPHLRAARRSILSTIAKEFDSLDRKGQRVTNKGANFTKAGTICSGVV